MPSDRYDDVCGSNQRNISSFVSHPGIDHRCIERRIFAGEVDMRSGICGRRDADYWDIALGRHFCQQSRHASAGASQQSRSMMFRDPYNIFKY
ncbi:hypothetical protein D7U89_06885 [Stenotrophomonas maltophilia]|nr:hypothetical protein [Stenotrophomonas maltophilia]PSD09801.1 hypothetical protein C7E14_22300 [Stenotrophomonas maltophilia]